MAMHSTTTFTIHVRGPHDEEEEEHTSALISQLSGIPKDAENLVIDEDTPSNVEWRLLGDHFTNVKNLELDAGFNEDLNDRNIPLHWPLKRLMYASSGGEVFQSPFVLEGKVEHLILKLTYELRFEEPRTAELERPNDKAIERGEKQQVFTSRIEVTSVAELGTDWMEKKYAGKTEFAHPDRPFPEQVKLRKLEILENDALDTLTRMSFALPHLLNQVKFLNIRSTHNLDFHLTSEELVPKLLPQLSALETLVLSVGEVFKRKTILTKLYENLPPNLTTLRFRGPASLMQSEHWQEWIQAFANPAFLPQLKTLSFVLDLFYKEDEYKWRKETRAPEDALLKARAACEELYEVVRDRGISLEPFYDEWSEQHSLFRQVDERWML
ncbi:hypothetical protein VTO42DRAFT_7859 [Malbranchea cinnamomea]